MVTYCSTAEQDSMRRWLLPFQGYRVVVTEPDGSQRWAAVPRQGRNLFTEDHRSSGTSGGQWRAKRVPHTPQDFSEVGYNQVFPVTNFLTRASAQFSLVFSFS